MPLDSDAELARKGRGYVVQVQPRRRPRFQGLFRAVTGCGFASLASPYGTMKIALLTLGTRGDVQPFIALGKALKTCGHDVVLGAPDNFRSWIEQHGLAYRSIGVDMQVFVQSLEARKVMAGNVFAMARLWRRSIVPLTRRSLEATWEAARDADIIIHHPKTDGAADVCEATGAARFQAAPFPIFPTVTFPLFVLPGNYGPWLNRLSYRLLLFSRLLFLPTVNRWREEMLGVGKASLFRRPAAGNDRTVRRGARDSRNGVGCNGKNRCSRSDSRY